MECKLNFHTADDGDSDSDASEGDFLQLPQPDTPLPITEGPWRQLTPLPQLRISGAADCKMLSSFDNGLFSPSSQQEDATPRGEHTEFPEPIVIDQRTLAGPADAQASQEQLRILQGRITALEEELRQGRVAGGAACGGPPHAAATGSPMTLLVQDVDRGLEDIQQTCQYAGESAGDFVESKLEKLRRLLHERQAQGLPSAAGEVSALRAELSRLTERLSSEMAEVREFVTTETADVCAFLEERLEDFASQQPASAAEDAKSPSGDAGQALSLQAAGGSGQVSWSGASGQWAPAGAADDGAFLTQMPRNVQQLWHCLQRGVQHVEGLRLHTEEHLEAVHALCEFADARLNDINQLHDRFEERIEDLQAAHRETEGKLARLHSQQAQASGKLQALSFAGTLSRPQLPLSHASSARSPASSASSASAHHRGSDTASPGGWSCQVLMNGVVLLAVAALLAAVAFGNEPLLVAT